MIVPETKLNRPTEKTRFHIVIQPKGVYLKYSINDYFNKNLDTAYIGSSYFLSAVPLGSLVYNLEARPRGGGCFVRAAGCYGQVLQKGLLVLVKLPSGNVIHFSGKCRCVIGVVSNELFLLVNNIKAGKSRWLGQRPKVRGVAINPIDHPHGGGEGKAKIGRHPVTPWGKLTKGKRTKKNKL